MVAAKRSLVRKVFLSSTARDLGPHREAVFKAISSLDGFQCVRMEDFGARAWEADPFCRAKVAECNVFVGLVGHLYGSSPEGNELSFTEREHDAAVKAGVPRLLFLASDDLPLPPSLREPDEKWQRQLRFRDRLRKERIVGFFDLPDRLRADVVTALRNWEQEVLGKVNDAPQKRPRSRLIVERVRDPRSLDVISAMELYAARIPASEQVNGPDFIRWLRDDEEKRREGERSRDFMFVAKQRGEVCGFALLHSNPERRLGFVAYLVAVKGLKDEDRTISAALLEEVARLFAPGGELADHSGILLEVEDPRSATSPDHQREQLARIRLFCALAVREGFVLRALDFPYRQPFLHIPQESERGCEIPLLLMFAQPQGARIERSFDQARVRELLEFMYQWLYPEGFSEIEEENAEYRRYVAELHAALSEQLPERVPAIDLGHIQSWCGGKP